MDKELSKKIDEIMFEANDKINAIVNEVKMIKFSKLDEDEKQTKFNELRKEFEKVMSFEEQRVKEIMKKNS